MSLFASDAERAFFNWLYQQAAEFADENVDDRRCFELAGEKLQISEELIEWAYGIAYKQGALEAGIPLSVIEGKAKLSDHFSPEYIAQQRGKL